MSTPYEVLLLLVSGFAAGAVNTLAGGGSIITVPVLVLVGLPGTIANGTNRVGVLLNNLVGAWRFHRHGISGWRPAIAVLLPVSGGSLAGATIISSVDDRTFELVFAVVMLLLVVPILRGGRTPETQAAPWPPWLRAVVFALIGFYGGLFQAGVGILLIAALAHCGFDLLTASAIKLVVNAGLTLVAVAVFVARAQVAWLPAAVLTVGFVAGTFVGVRLALLGGERLIRAVLAATILLLAGKILGLY